MPYFAALSSDFSEDELRKLKRAFEEVIGMLGARGIPAKEREAASAIIGAAQVGCFNHSQLVAIGLAAARKASDEPAETEPLARVAGRASR